MSDILDVVVLSATRTAIGGFGGGLKDMAPADLGAVCIKEAVRRADLAPETVETCVVGHVVRTQPKDAYVSRMAAIEGGLPIESQSLTVNRLCGSGLEAIVLAAQQIQVGEAEIAVAGGTEVMSRASYSLPSARWGGRLGNMEAYDEMLGALTDPFGTGHMGVTAEKVAEQFSIDRETQDAFALESQRRAVKAIEEGRFESQIVPVEIKTRKGTVVIDKDEHPRAETTLEGLAKLRPAFQKEGSVTAGNASGINDGAAMVALASKARAERDGLKPLARLVSYARAGVEPSIMGTGPIPAVKRALEQAGLTVADLDVIESNEAFAAQACAVSQALGLPEEKTNPNGGAIALGHPIGATGAILTTKCLYELQRTSGRYGLVTMCIGGGQGIAAIFEAL